MFYLSINKKGNVHKGKGCRKEVLEVPFTFQAPEAHFPLSLNSIIPTSANTATISNVGSNDAAAKIDI